MSKILVVDDNESIREVLRLLLTGEGFFVRTARDGGEALDILQHESGWLILLDLMMPRLDGRAVLTYLRLHPDLLDFQHGYFDDGHGTHDSRLPGPLGRGRSRTAQAL